MRQIIIAVGREFGSGGHIIAEKLAEYYNIPLYSKTMLEEIAKDSNYTKEFLEKFDEKPMSFTFTPMHMVGGVSSFEQDVAIKQFEFLRKKADEEKESFVVIGRCAEEILKNNPNLVSVFVLGDKDSKCKRVMERENISEADALAKMKKEDKMRKTYHNFYCDSKWGDSRNYDICVKTGKVDIEVLVKMIIEYIDAK